MTAKIGKLSLIIGAILNVLLIAAGLVIWKLELFLKVFPEDKAEHFWFMFIPFGTMLLSHFMAWLICLKTRKKGEPPQEKTKSFNAFFKTYFYLWTLVTIVIAVCGVLLLNFSVYRLSNVVSCHMISMGIAWFCTVIVCIMVWAAFSAWAANEVVGVVVALIAFVLLAGSSVLTGILYKQFMETFEFTAAVAEERRIAEEAAQRAAEEAAWQAEDAKRIAKAAPMLAAETRFDKAYRFMEQRLHLNSDRQPIDLIDSYIGMPYGSYYDDQSIRETFYGANDFETCKDDFYAILAKSKRNSSELLSIAIYYSKTMKAKGNILSAQKFERSGTKDLVKILLWAYNDIQSKQSRESGSNALAEIYSIMSRTPSYEEWSRYTFPNSYYEDLLPYMSKSTIREISRVNKNSSDWANIYLATWTYSFWGRRYNDGVDKAFYNALKTIEALYK